MKTLTGLLSIIWLVASFSSASGQTTTRTEITPTKRIEDPALIRKIPPPAPVVVLTAKEVYDITSTTARCLYEVTNNGAEIVQHGVCVSKGTAPTVNGTFFIPKNLGPVFNAEMINLSPAMKFYVRAFAKLKSGEVIYGNELSFYTLSPPKK
jgi:hypothetical protein